MAKKPKPEPVNATDRKDGLPGRVEETEILHADEDPPIALLSIATEHGIVSVWIDEEVASTLGKQIEAFLTGDAPSIVDALAEAEAMGQQKLQAQKDRKKKKPRHP